MRGTPKNKELRDAVGEKRARAAAAWSRSKATNCWLRGQEALFQTGLQLSSEKLEK